MVVVEAEEMMVDTWEHVRVRARVCTCVCVGGSAAVHGGVYVLLGMDVGVCVYV